MATSPLRSPCFAHTLPRPSTSRPCPADASEGLFTVVCGFASFGILPRTPGTAWWLKPDERAALVAALERDAPAAEQREKLTLAACVSALKAPQVWFMFAQFFASGAMLYAMAYCELRWAARCSGTFG